jgi:hypothetical protein
MSFGLLLGRLAALAVRPSVEMERWIALKLHWRNACTPRAGEYNSCCARRKFGEGL